MPRRPRRRNPLARAGRFVRRWLPHPPRAAWALVVVAVVLAADVAYQLVRKPTEIVGLVSPTSAKAPEATWADYRRLFEANSTDVIRPELLAALVQVESAGDPLARTYWRWQWSWNPLQIYRPASSAVGLLQMTDGTFAEASQLCIRDHAVARSGAWHDPRACWFNAFYFRTIPGHAIEMTAARLHQSVVDTLPGNRFARATLDQKQRLAAVIHLCGRERGAAYAKRGFWVMPGERCGDHDLARYLARVQELKRIFARMDAAG